MSVLKLDLVALLVTDPCRWNFTTKLNLPKVKEDKVEGKKKTGRHEDRKTDRLEDKNTGRQEDRKTGRQIEKETWRLEDKKTHIHKYNKKLNNRKIGIKFSCKMYDM